MIIVTGGAGFIGSNLVKALNHQGESDILVVDNLSNNDKSANLADLKIRDYMDKNSFFEYMSSGKGFENLDVVLHQGACSDTMETDGKYMLHNNFIYSKSVFKLCVEHNAAFIYASSASVYGNGIKFKECPKNESTLNTYAWSKLLFDNYIRAVEDISIQCAGLRYFNVYGPREFHKSRMASVAWHFNNQYKENGSVNLFSGSGGYDDGEQLRDFVYIDDVVNVNLFLIQHPGVNGIFNVGTGRGQSFNEVALAVINYHKKAQGKQSIELSDAVNNGEINYIAMPEALCGRYQSYTQADLESLRSTGFSGEFRHVTTGVNDYLSAIS